MMGKKHSFIKLNLILLGAYFWINSVNADENITDQYPGSFLYSKPVEVIPNIWSAIGATGPPTYENTGHNNNLSFIITGEGVVVINSGASALLAQALHKEIKEITAQPVVLVVNENGQGQTNSEFAVWKSIKHESLGKIR